MRTNPSYNPSPPPPLVPHQLGHTLLLHAPLDSWSGSAPSRRLEAQGKQPLQLDSAKIKTDVRKFLERAPRPGASPVGFVQFRKKGGGAKMVILCAIL